MLPLPPPRLALPSVLINIRTSVQTVVVGHAVEFECLAMGDPKPQVTWSKVGGRLRPGIMQSGGIVRIAHVEMADAGQYRCTATNAAGTTQSHVLLLVQGEGRWDLCGVGERRRGFSRCPLPHLLYSSTLLGIFNFVYLRGGFRNSGGSRDKSECSSGAGWNLQEKTTARGIRKTDM